MATHISSRILLSKLSLLTTKSLPGVFSRTISSIAPLPPTSVSSSSLSLLLRRLRPLSATSLLLGNSHAAVRCLSTRATASSLNDQSPNWSNRPPKETILLEGCDFEHWLVVMEPPEGNPTREEIIDSYIKTLAMVVGSEEEARMKIYSVSTRCYYAFGALVPEEVSFKIKELPRVRWVLPDSYLDVKNKDYGGEPFINGEAVPYDPKYHEEWIRNNAKANERNRRNDRPRSFDRSRNYERRRENMSPPPNSNMPPPGNPSPGGNMPPNNFNQMPPPNMGAAPQGNMGGPPQGNFGGGPPQGNFGGGPPQGNFGGGPPQGNFGGGPPQGNYGGGPPQGNYGGPPPPPQGNYGGPPPPPPQGNYGGGPPQGNYGAPPPQGGYGGGMPQGSYGGMQQNYGGFQGSNTGGMPPPNMPPQNAGWSNNAPGPQNNQGAQYNGYGGIPGGKPHQG